MTDTTIREEALALACNLASLWTGGRAVLEMIVQDAGERNVSPLDALNTLNDGDLNARFSGTEDRRLLSAAYGELQRYLTSDSWFARAAPKDTRLSQLQRGPVAYFCMEYGLASWLPIYSGGLGILAGDVLKEASDMGLPFVAVGLFYRQGFFQQRLDASNCQTECLSTVDPAQLPVAVQRDSMGAELRVPVPVAGRTICARIWKLQVGRVPLYLLDTDVSENERSEDRAITANLYGGNEDLRIQQELVLGIGGIRALRALGVEPSVFSMNEGHAAFLGLELLGESLAGTDFSTALSHTRRKVAYTNHTVVPAGNDVFSHDLVCNYVCPYAESQGISRDQLLGLATSGSGSGFSMALLAFQLSGKANAVSRLHAEVIPRAWPGYAVEAVTNGVHVPTWLGPRIRELLDAYVPDWHHDDPDWSAIRTIPDDVLVAARNAQRQTMIDYVNAATGCSRLDPATLTIVWARRFAEYKRAWLIASDLARLSRILTNPYRPVQLIISGKSHPHDEGGKGMLQRLLNHLEEDREVATRVTFVEDYSEAVARQLVSGADVWLNTPRKPLEASGTSGMKSSDNGGIQLTVTDGWAAEVDWWSVGWGMEGRDDQYDAQQLYTFLEQGVVPTFYDRDVDGVSHSWAAMMKNTMVLTLSRYSTRRMMHEYVDKLYLPLIQESREAAATGTMSG